MPQSLYETTYKTPYRGLLFALAELSYAPGQEFGRQDAYYRPAEVTVRFESRKVHTIKAHNRARMCGTQYYLAAAIYAYLYLLGHESTRPPNPFDRRLRVASDLYNLGVMAKNPIRFLRQQSNVAGQSQGPVSRHRIPYTAALIWRACTA